MLRRLWVASCHGKSRRTSKIKYSGHFQQLQLFQLNSYNACRQISELKQHWDRLVLGWVTADFQGNIPSSAAVENC